MSASIGSEDAPGPRPETLLLALFGDHVLDRGFAISTTGVIEVLGRLGVGEHAARATLRRMSSRGLLSTVKQGRQAFLELAPRGVEVMRDGQRKLEEEVVDRHWDGRWTLLTFSIPEARRADRHALRTQLAWCGFGLLRSGLWVSTSVADVSQVLAGLDLLDHAEVFRAEAFMWTDPARVAREAWKLTELAASHTRFIGRWTDGLYDHLDELSRRILLSAEWLLQIRNDPRLPLVLLPEDWPGVQASELYGRLRRRLAPAAEKLAAEVFETVAGSSVLHPSAGC